MINRDDQYVIVLTPQDEILEARLEALKSFLITPREFEISAMILKGFSNREIGEHLNIAPSTVKTHLNNIYRKIPKHLLTR
ncbi:MAG: helix-turn-helix transcriptional regulator [Pseudobdellovibrionaceae bacterium]|nr:MAG: helix-turn-helix transcriptional regulator [Pseudobdellovibrionaceae bacterium]